MESIHLACVTDRVGKHSGRQQWLEIGGEDGAGGAGGEH